MGRRPSDLFTAEHARIATELARARDGVGAMSAGPTDVQARLAHEVIERLQREVLSHDQWEDRVLYPIVDKHAGSGAYVYTATLRHEHRVIARWIGELEALAEAPALDVVAFVRRADNLLGLLLAHLEAEE